MDIHGLAKGLTGKSNNCNRSKHEECSESDCGCSCHG